MNEQQKQKAIEWAKCQKWVGPFTSLETITEAYAAYQRILAKRGRQS